MESFTTEEIAFLSVSVATQREKLGKARARTTVGSYDYEEFSAAIARADALEEKLSAAWRERWQSSLSPYARELLASN